MSIETAMNQLREILGKGLHPTAVPQVEEVLRNLKAHMNQHDRWLIIVWWDQEPSLDGPFTDGEAMDNRARERAEEGNYYGIYTLDIIDGIPTVEAYSGEE